VTLFLNSVMAPVWVLPSVIGITFLVSLSTQLFNHKMVNQKVLKEKRKRMKDLQKQIRTGIDKSELNKINDELMKLNGDIMKMTMKPTFYTFVPMIIVFGILSAFFSPYGDLIEFPINLPLFGPAVSWLGTYIIFSLIFSFTLKPLLTRISDKRAKARS